MAEARKIIKNSIKVEINCVGGHSFTVDDAELTGAGTALYAQLAGADGVLFATGEDTAVFMPYCSICHAEITTTVTEEDAPEDTTCVPEE